MEERTRKLIRNLILAFILGAIMILIPQLLGFGASGFSTPGTSPNVLLQQFYFYIETGVGFLVLIMIIFFAEILIKKDDNLYGDSVAFASQGETPALSLFKRVTAFQLFLGSFIIFSILGLVNFLTNQTVFTGVLTLAQQFTSVDNILYSGALVPIAENLGAALMIALALFGLRWWGRKHSLGSANFRIMAITLIPILIGLYGLTNHLLRYSSSDASLIVVFFFWTVGGLITILSGSFIPFWILHLTNNLFFDLKKYFSSDAVVIYVVIGLIVMIVGFILLYFRKKKPADINNI